MLGFLFVVGLTWPYVVRVLNYGYYILSLGKACTTPASSRVKVLLLREQINEKQKDPRFTSGQRKLQKKSLAILLSCTMVTLKYKDESLVNFSLNCFKIECKALILGSQMKIEYCARPF